MRKNGAFKYIRPRTYITVAFALLLVFLAVTNYWVLSNDKIPPLHDANVCYSSSCEYYKYFAQGFQFDHLKRFFVHINFYPPLYMLIPTSLYHFTGPNYHVMAMVNIFYLFLLIYSIYKLGNFIFGRSGGLLAAIVLLAFPSIIGFSRITHINIALTAIVAINIYTLLKSDSFNNRQFSIVAGIIAGLGCWFSSKYMIYFIFPAVICLLYSIFSRESRLEAFKKSKIINRMFFLGTAIFISVPYYVPAIMHRIQPESAIIYRAASLDILGIVTNFNMHQFFAHIFQYIGFLRPLILTPNFALFVLSLIIVMPTSFKNRDRIILLGWFLAPFFMLSLFSGFIEAQPRFLLPVLPFIAIVISGALLRTSKLLKLHFAKIGILLMVALIALIIGLDWTFFLKQHPYPRSSGELLASRTQYGLLHTVDKETPVAELFDFLDAEAADNDSRRIIVTVFEDDNDTAPLALELIYDKLKNARSDIRIFTPMGISIASKLRQYGYKQNEDFIKGVFMSADYILYIKNKRPQFTMGRPEERLFRNNKILKDMFFQDKDSLKLLWQSHPAPDNFFSEELLLYRFGANE